MAVEVKPGTRLRSAVCGTEVVVVRTRTNEVDMRCGGRPMLLMDAPRVDGVAPEPGYDEPTALGKRYADDEDQIEVLCTTPGPSTLSIGENRLVVKGAKPLPASD
jgi:hypothetical protein